LGVGDCYKQSVPLERQGLCIGDFYKQGVPAERKGLAVGDCYKQSVPAERKDCGCWRTRGKLLVKSPSAYRMLFFQHCNRSYQKGDCKNDEAEGH